MTTATKGRDKQNVNIVEKTMNEELTALATSYYIDGLTQEELSKRFGVSRATIGRLLRRAQEEGIVEIRVRQHPKVTLELEGELVRRFGIARALIAPDHPDPDRQRSMVAALAASYLDSRLQDGMVVAVGMGRNVAAVSDHAISTAQRACTFVCAIGGSYRGGQTINADHICRRLVAQFGGESETLYAPAMVDSPQMRQSLIENDTVRPTLEKARRADIALIGLGDISSDSHSVRMGWFTPEQLAVARANGTVGHMMAYDFIDIHGRSSVQPNQRRIVGLSIEDLKRIPNVMAVASEVQKSTAILGALRTGVIHAIATSASVATAVLQMDQVLPARAD